MHYYRYRPGGFTDSVIADMKFEQYLRTLAEGGREKSDKKKANATRKVAAKGEA